MAKILLVEDDKSLREIYGVRLIAEGYEIISAGDGEEALAIAVKQQPDLIISDVMMPKISGFDMLDILRQTPETKDIKVIMMTALSSEDQRARGESLGADKYLVKSQVGIEDVVRTVHEVLKDKEVPGEPAPSAPANPEPAAPQQSIMQPTPAVQPTPPIAEPAPILNSPAPDTQPGQPELAPPIIEPSTPPQPVVPAPAQPAPPAAPIDQQPAQTPQIEPINDIAARIQQELGADTTNANQPGPNQTQ